MIDALVLGAVIAVFAGAYWAECRHARRVERQLALDGLKRAARRFDQ